LLTIILVLTVFNALLALLSLSAVGRTFKHHNDLADAMIAATNFQTQKLVVLTNGIYSALDCLVTVDAQRSESE
jgi:hypothetical protein